MSYTIGPVGQFGEFSYAFRVTLPELTESQFEFIDRCLDEEASDTYPDAANRTSLIVFEDSHDGGSPEGFRDYLVEERIDKFIRRCCDPASPLFISQAEYELIDAENAF